MEECAELITTSLDDRRILSGLTSSGQYTNSVYLQKNPFDHQFALALRNKINGSTNYGHQLSLVNSPLNTPVIPLNDSVGFLSSSTDDDLSDANAALVPPTTAQITNLIVEAEQERLELEAAKSEQQQDRSDVDLNVLSDVPSRPIHSRQVSVICTPVPTSRSCENNPINEAINSVSAALRSIAESDRLKSSAGLLSSSSTNTSSIAPLLESSDSLSHDSSSSSLSSSLPGKLSPSLVSSSSPPRESVVTSSTEAILNTALAFNLHNSYSNLIRILPKPNSVVDSSTVDISLGLSSLTPARRKEKTLDELINKIRETEAALPPKAKPGRKSKHANEENQHEKKRLSLERNRAAAMRCRLKKKKEIDELKFKVEEYERQNRELRRQTEELKWEVTTLKSELLRHKDCC